MISVDIDNVRFNLRVGGVCVDDGYVLVNRNPGDDWYYLPGGRCEPMEATDQTLLREIQEELELPIRLDGLLWVVENFFRMNGRDWHEIGFYYRCSLPADCPYLDKTRSYERIESADGLPLIFEWLPLADLATVKLLPIVLRAKLMALPASPEHIVHWDAPAIL
ncbi:MAG: NUDIX hydrolase [Thermomicrobiales bacterium]